MKVTILGSGASAGVPVIGCDCAVCRSEDPRDKRSRVSVLVEVAGKRLLVDTSPDLREQALREGMKNVDAILYTHGHADHTHGIDEVKAFNYHADAVIPAFGMAETMEELKERFGYAFLPPIREYGWFRPALEAREILAGEVFDAAGVSVRSFGQWHGRHLTLGFRVGDFAYSTDCNRLDDAAFEALLGVKLWVVDCLRREPAPTHAHLDLVLEWIARVKPERAVLIHMSHDLGYRELLAELPQGVEPGFDGLSITLP